MTDEIQLNHTVKGTITALAFGGEGILRHEGYVLFVPYAAVGDHVQVRIVEKKARFGKALIEEIISPGNNRIKPPCPYFGTCGGCQLQHLTSEQQLLHKVQWLQDAFTRVGHLPWTLKPRAFAAQENWCYRRHIRLTLTPKERNGTEEAEGKVSYTLGYQGVNPGVFVPIQQCALFLPQEDPFFIRLEQLLEGVAPSGPENGSLSLIKLGEKRLFSHYVFQKPLSKVARLHLLQNWKCDDRLVGMALETPNGREVIGDHTGEFSFNELNITFSPFAFIQAHPTQSALLYNQVKETVERLAPRSVLDLYCGIGVTSLVCALSGARVRGIEGNAEAIACANENRTRNQIKGVDFLCTDVARVCGAELRTFSPDFVLVNPPRTGMNPKVREELLKRPPRSLLYISCMPPTMARDLAPFAEKGFVPTDCAVVDMFPQTTHMETMLLLERT